MFMSITYLRLDVEYLLDVYTYCNIILYVYNTNIMYESADREIVCGGNWSNLEAGARREEGKVGNEEFGEKAKTTQKTMIVVS